MAYRPIFGSTPDGAVSGVGAALSKVVANASATDRYQITYILISLDLATAVGNLTVTDGGGATLMEEAGFVGDMKLVFPDGAGPRIGDPGETLIFAGDLVSGRFYTLSFGYRVLD